MKKKCFDFEMGYLDVFQKIYEVIFHVHVYFIFNSDISKQVMYGDFASVWLE